MVQQHWAIRTVRNGKVKILGKWYKPDDEYNGELEGQRFVFGLYWCGNERRPFIFLWGPEQNFRERDHNKYVKNPCHINGYIYWSWWREL